MGKTKKANVTITETKDIDENMVYVYNSKQSTNIPSLSPPCLAFETYLRMIQVDYKKASNEKQVQKTHGDPKIMINRLEYSGYENCMENVFSQFKKDQENLADCDLTDDQKADVEAYIKADVETVLFGALNAVRTKKAQEATTHDLMKRIKNQAQQLWKPKEMDDRSMSKMSFEDLSKKIKESLTCLSNYLRRAGISKWFFGGSKPTKHDAIVFGVLAQFFYEPNEELNLKEFFDDKNVHNLVDYLNHIKDTYWSNWEQCCAPLPPPPVVKETIKEKETPVPIPEVNGAQQKTNGEPTPNGAVGDEDKSKSDEPKIAPKAVEESPKTEDKKIIPSPVVDVVVPPVVVAVETTTPSSDEAKVVE